MYTKLTLRVDNGIISQMKTYAAEHKTSLSKVVEQYFRALVQKRQKKEISPIVKELSGIIKTKRKVDTKSEVRDYLTKKYLR